jgi:hypothetical protein
LDFKRAVLPQPVTFEITREFLGTKPSGAIPLNAQTATSEVEFGASRDSHPYNISPVEKMARSIYAYIRERGGLPYVRILDNPHWEKVRQLAVLSFTPQHTPMRHLRMRIFASMVDAEINLRRHPLMNKQFKESEWTDFKLRLTAVFSMIDMMQQRTLSTDDQKKAVDGLHELIKDMKDYSLSELNPLIDDLEFLHHALKIDIFILAALLTPSPNTAFVPCEDIRLVSRLRGQTQSAAASVQTLVMISKALRTLSAAFGADIDFSSSGLPRSQKRQLDSAVKEMQQAVSKQIALLTTALDMMAQHIRDFPQPNGPNAGQNLRAWHQKWASFKAPIDDSVAFYVPHLEEIKRLTNSNKHADPLFSTRFEGCLRQSLFIAYINASAIHSAYTRLVEPLVAFTSDPGLSQSSTELTLQLYELVFSLKDKLPYDVWADLLDWVSPYATLAYAEPEPGVVEKYYQNLVTAVDSARKKLTDRKGDAALQAILDQINHYERLAKPLFNSSHFWPEHRLEIYRWMRDHFKRPIVDRVDMGLIQKFLNFQRIFLKGFTPSVDRTKYESAFNVLQDHIQAMNELRPNLLLPDVLGADALMEKEMLGLSKQYKTTAFALSETPSLDELITYVEACIRLYHIFYETKRAYDEKNSRFFEAVNSVRLGTQEFQESLDERYRSFADPLFSVCNHLGAFNLNMLEIYSSRALLRLVRDSAPPMQREAPLKQAHRHLPPLAATEEPEIEDIVPPKPVPTLTLEENLSSYALKAGVQNQAPVTECLANALASLNTFNTLTEAPIPKSLQPHAIGRAALLFEQVAKARLLANGQTPPTSHYLTDLARGLDVALSPDEWSAIQASDEAIIWVRYPSSKVEVDLEQAKHLKTASMKLLATFTTPASRHPKKVRFPSLEQHNSNDALETIASAARDVTNISIPTDPLSPHVSDLALAAASLQAALKLPPQSRAPSALLFATTALEAVLKLVIPATNPTFLKEQDSQAGRPRHLTHSLSSFVRELNCELTSQEAFWLDELTAYIKFRHQYPASPGRSRLMSILQDLTTLCDMNKTLQTGFTTDAIAKWCKPNFGEKTPEQWASDVSSQIEAHLTSNVYPLIQLCLDLCDKIQQPPEPTPTAAPAAAGSSDD